MTKDRLFVLVHTYLRAWLKKNVDREGRKKEICMRSQRSVPAFFAVSGSPFPKTVIDGSSNYLKLAQEVLSELPELGHVRLDEDAAVEQPAPRV